MRSNAIIPGKGLRLLSRPVRLAITLATALTAASSPSRAASDLLDLSLEELAGVEVLSVSRKAQRLADTPAAVTVLTNEDIMRSGARSVPEALRLVPGVQVARIGSGRWAVSVRGLNGRYASKLLVQIDGRSIYSPLFSGVFWDIENFMLEDVARIEIVRGPGASLWGANAVNGVINIVTKRASETRGTLVRLSIDHRGTPEAAVRQGFELGDWADGRVYALTTNRASFETIDGHRIEDAQDGWRVGFRVDSKERDRWSVSGSAYQHRGEETIDLPTPGAIDALLDYEGANLLASRKWDWLGGEATLRAYLDYQSIDMNPVAGATVSTGDVDFQHRLMPMGRHEWIWGLGMRYQNAEARARRTTLRFDPEVTQLKTVSAFAQDEITLVPKEWRLSLGARFEARNESTPEWQPSARLMWTPTDRDSLWAHWSRAVRTPSIGERTTDFILGTQLVSVPPFGTFPFTLVSRANPDLKPENLRAIELGYRRQLDAGNLEVVLFRHRYDGLVSQHMGSVDPLTQRIYIDRGSAGKAVSEGLELAADTRLHRNVRLLAAYTLLRVHFDGTDDATQAAASDAIQAHNANHWLTLQARVDLPGRRQLDTTIRHSGALKAPGSERVSSYTVTDVQYLQRVSENFEWSLGIYDLFDEHHTEFNSDQFPSPYAYDGRRAVLTGRWQF